MEPDFTPLVAAIATNFPATAAVLSAIGTLILLIGTILSIATVLVSPPSTALGGDTWLDNIVQHKAFRQFITALEPLASLK